MSTSIAAPQHSREKVWQALSLVARLIPGIVFLISGAQKLGDLEASAAATRAFKILPYDAANLFGYMLPVVELALGVLLLLGLFTRVSALLGSLLMIAFIVGIISVWVRGISIDCGCFGGGGALDPDTALARYPWDIARDVALLACMLFAAYKPRHRWSLDQLLLGAPASNQHSNTVVPSPAEDAHHADDKENKS